MIEQMQIIATDLIVLGAIGAMTTAIGLVLAEISLLLFPPRN